MHVIENTSTPRCLHDVVGEGDDTSRHNSTNNRKRINRQFSFSFIIV